MESWRREKKSLAVLSIRLNGSLCRRDDREGGCPSSGSEDHHPLIRDSRRFESCRLHSSRLIIHFNEDWPERSSCSKDAYCIG